MAGFGISGAERSSSSVTHTQSLQTISKKVVTLISLLQMSIIKPLQPNPESPELTIEHDWILYSKQKIKQHLES
jgi:hypothetical protein